VIGYLIMNKIGRSLYEAAERGVKNITLESRKLIKDFIYSQWSEHGGFVNRSGEVDLYYTAFGLDCAAALKLEINKNKAKEYLNRFTDIEALDSVHLVSLNRCWRRVGEVPKIIKDSISRRTVSELSLLADKLKLLTHDGPGDSTIEINHVNKIKFYEIFVLLTEAEISLWSLMAELGRKLVLPFNILNESVGSLIIDYVGGTTTVVAAVTMMFDELRVKNRFLVEHLLRMQCENGGFFASPRAKKPDLLSTAAAVHALSYVMGDCYKYYINVEAHAGFVEDLWKESGGFVADLTDNQADCEYTYYGLMCAGNLM